MTRLLYPLAFTLGMLTGWTVFMACEAVDAVGMNPFDAAVPASSPPALGTEGADMGARR